MFSQFTRLRFAVALCFVGCSLASVGCGGTAENNSVEKDELTEYLDANPQVSEQSNLSE
jgi:hypothetical protein